jgi:hypothetical protein
VSYGFIYMLHNEWMPDVVKIGFTDRSPHQRAEELSAPTGVPIPFVVVCYVEVENAQDREAELHRLLHEARVNDKREFSYCRAERAKFVGYFQHHPEAVAYTAVDVPQFVVGDTTPEVASVPNPWETPH